MAKQSYIIDQFYGGISQPEKPIVRGPYAEKEYRFHSGQNLQILDDPGQFSLNPAAVKDSGSTVTGLVKWIVSGQPHNSNTYFYDSDGKIYRRTSGGTWSELRDVASSVGQGMAVYDDYLYYVQNTQIGRYGPLSGVPSFTDNWQTGLTDTSGTGFAPAIAFGTSIYFGHGNKIAQWDGTTFTLAKLTLLAGQQVRCVDTNKEFMVFGTWAGTTIAASESGFMYIWDGISTNYNRLIDTDGGVNAILNNKNRLLSVIGSSGWLYEGVESVKSLQNFGRLPFANYAEVYPGAVTNWRGRAYFGFGANTDSTEKIQGVYHWTALSDAYPEGMNLSFTISTGQRTNVKIGALGGIGDNLFIGWQDDNGTTTYGVDKVVYNASPYATGYLDTTLIDDKRPMDDKIGLTMEVSHLPLRQGESIQLGYFNNRGTLVTGDVNSTVNSNVTRLPIKADQSRFKEMQLRVILNAVSSTAPVGTSIALQQDTNTEEESY